MRLGQPVYSAYSILQGCGLPWITSLYHILRYIVLQKGNHLKLFKVNSGVVSLFAFYPLSAFPTIPMSFKLNMSHLSLRLLQKIRLHHYNTNGHIHVGNMKNDAGGTTVALTKDDHQFFKRKMGRLT